MPLAEGLKNLPWNQLPGNTEGAGLCPHNERPECVPQESWLGRQESEQKELELAHSDWTKYEGTRQCVMGSKSPKLLGPIYR